MRLSLSELLHWMDISHPDQAADPQYWWASDPDDPGRLITVAVWPDADGSLVAQIVETTGWSDPAIHHRSQVLWHLRVIPIGDGDVLIDRLAVGGTTLPRNDLHTLRRELLQFREVVRVVRGGGFARNRAFTPRTPVLLGDPEDGSDHRLGPPPGRRKAARRPSRQSPGSHSGADTDRSYSR